MNSQTRCAPPSFATIAPATSTLLDMLRAGAALIVFVYHLANSWFFPRLGIRAEFGHDAVTLFFVLSGYLIAYSIEGHRRRTAREYALARLSRLCSVVMPALVLTVLLLQIGDRLNPELYRQFYRGFDGLRLMMAACFLQEIWFVSASPPTNGVLWSLGYEFWYYVFFGIWIYGSHRFSGMWLLLAAVILAGPKIVLLFPIWLLGAGAFVFGKRVRLSPSAGMTGLLGSLMLLVLLWWTNWRSPCSLGIAPLYHSGWFLSDYVFGLIVSAALVFFDRAFVLRELPPLLGRIAKAGADVSFSLYVYHYPLLIFAAAVVPFDHSSATQALSVGGGVIICVVLLSKFTEARRRHLHKWMERMADRIFGPRSKASLNPPSSTTTK